jgi:predicted PurR-regulated permease PerM
VVKTAEEPRRIDQISVSSANAVALWIVAVVATVFFLRAAEMLLIPIALAVLISYALAPVVAWLEQYRVPRLAGAGLVLLLILGASVRGAYALGDDARDLASTLPRAVQRAREEMLARLGADTEALQQATEAPGASTQASEEAEGGQAAETSGGASPLVQRVEGSMLSLAGHLVVIVFLVYFLLIAGHQVRNRVIEIAGPERHRMASTIIDDINAQIQRYLLVLLVTAIAVAIATWAVLAVMGVRHAMTWGILAAVFNSMPYFGLVIVPKVPSRVAGSRTAFGQTLCRRVPRGHSRAVDARLPVQVDATTGHGHVERLGETSGRDDSSFVGPPYARLESATRGVRDVGGRPESG